MENEYECICGEFFSGSELPPHVEKEHLIVAISRYLGLLFSYQYHHLFYIKQGFIMYNVYLILRLNFPCKTLSPFESSLY